MWAMTAIGIKGGERPWEPSTLFRLGEGAEDYHNDKEPTGTAWRDCFDGQKQQWEGASKRDSGGFVAQHNETAGVRYLKSLWANERV